MARRHLMVIRCCAAELVDAERSITPRTSRFKVGEETFERAAKLLFEGGVGDIDDSGAVAFTSAGRE